MQWPPGEGFATFHTENLASSGPEAESGFNAASMLSASLRVQVPLMSGILSECAELGESITAINAAEHHAYREADQRAGIFNSSIVITPVFLVRPARTCERGEGNDTASLEF
jgi:hypothetical protein